MKRAKKIKMRTRHEVKRGKKGWEKKEKKTTHFFFPLRAKKKKDGKKKKIKEPISFSS